MSTTGHAVNQIMQSLKHPKEILINFDSATKFPAR